MLPMLIFITCNPAPATHFAVLGQTISSKYDVSYVAAGKGHEKLNEQCVQAINFNPEKLDLSRQEVQIKLAEEMAKKCSRAQIIVLDIGNIISFYLQKSVIAYTQNRGDKPPLFIAYYENPESWVPGGYSKTAAQVISVCQAILFANLNLANASLYQDKNIMMDLESIPRFGVGYSPIPKQAEKLRQERLDRQEKVRSNFFKVHKIEDNGQKIIVYLGENNTEYFDRALPKFLDFIEEGASKSVDLANSIIIFQQHPNAKSKNEEQRLLTTRNLAHKPHVPKCIISNLNSSEALILANVVLGRQSSIVYLTVLADIPYMQVAHEVYSDIVVTSGYPIATDISKFIELLQNLLSSFKEEPEKKTEVLKKLGFQLNWVENFENGLQAVKKNL